MNLRVAQRRESGARGFSLIEVLVAIVVLGVGLLGLAALQAFSSQANQSANFRTQATALAYDMLDRMRVNRGAVLRGSYYTAFDKPAGGCGADASSDSVAVRDIRQWKCAIEAQLPGGKGEVRMPGGIVTVAIKWKDARWSTDPDAEFNLTSKL